MIFTKRFTHPLLVLNTPQIMTDDDTAEASFFFDTDMTIVDLVLEKQPAAAGDATRIKLLRPPKDTGISWYNQEINPASAGRNRKGARLKAAAKYQFQVTALAGTLTAGQHNIIATLDDGR